ncbi:MAG: hypothetical protein GY940_33855, partial [bacterium]|nr:hypothetical protein [bacterium]
LMPLVTGKIAPSLEPVYCELDWLGWGNSVRLENLKYLVVGREKKERYLFDLGADPLEKWNLLGERPEQVEKLEAMLEQWLNAHPQFKAPVIKVPLDSRQENKLKTLGYL